ncbi:MAG: flagellar biosynthesis protein FlhB [Clostridiales bacterium]|jgi:flagellar biosynthetic protein FlhB|nr:flagellar biosynthesis protein FlhB [Clostridiales bacterium]
MAQKGSSEKTEKASPKKRRDARERGEVHKSIDIVTAVMLFIMFGAIRLGFSGFMEFLQTFVYDRMSSGVAEKAANITARSVMSDYKNILITVLPSVIPIMATGIVCAVLAHVLQTGPLFVTAKLKPDFSRINPVNGFQRLFSPTIFVELAKSLIKVAALTYVIYKYIKAYIPDFIRMIYTSPSKAFSYLMTSCFSMAITIALILISLSLLDALYQWWKYEKDLMMTKQEVKEEYKLIEGDPQIKGKIKQKQRRMSMMRMMRDLREATVVVTNPEHYAVALRYKENIDKAPVVVAKGQDYLALRIKEVAKKYNIAIVENKPVARALYTSCPIGSEIPPEMYQAIADILIYVYKTTNKR